MPSKKSAKTVKVHKVQQAPTPAPLSPEAAGFVSSKLILGVIVVIVLAGGVLLFLSQGSGQNASAQFPSFTQTNAANPSGISGIKGMSGPAATQQLASLAQGGLSNVSQFTISYSGSILADYSVLSVDSPLTVTLSKYGDNRRFAVNISNVEAFGPVSMIYINDTNGTYTCMNLNQTAMSDGNYQGVLLGSHAFTCSSSEIAAGINLGKISDFNFTQLSYSGVQFNYNQEYQSTYQGTPCTYLSGSITVPGSGSNGGLFQECVSNVYYVPLSFSLYETGSKGGVTLTLNETYISNSSSLSAISAMPN